MWWLVKRMRWFTAGVLLAACSAGAVAKEADQPAMLEQDHPLAGKIWDVAAQRFVSREQLAQALVQARYVLLGETHDNLLHHRHQGWAIEQISEAGRRPAAVFEMIDADQTAALTPPPDHVDAVFDVLDWESRGWPARALYRPVFAAAVAANWPLVAGNLPRKELREVITTGEEAVPDEVTALLQRRALTAAERDAMLQDIVESHCHMLPPAHAESMILGQRTRDGYMANAMLEQATDDGAVLIAGTGHTRRDLGVPSYLAAAGAQKVLSVAWHEVREELERPAEYAGAVWGRDTLPFDYVWFTPRVERPDPCEEIREFQRKQREERESKEQAGSPGKEGKP